MPESSGQLDRQLESTRASEMLAFIEGDLFVHLAMYVEKLANPSMASDAGAPQLQKSIEGSYQQQGRGIKTWRGAGELNGTYRMAEDCSDGVTERVQNSHDDGDKVEDRANPPGVVERERRK